MIGHLITAAELVSLVNLKGKGKLPTFASGSPAWLKILAIANFYIDQWAREPSVDWYSLYDPAFAIGNITATDTYDLPDELRNIDPQEGDSVRITLSSTQWQDYDVIDASRLKEFNNGLYVAQIGRQIKFNRAFVSTDTAFGKALTVPGFTTPDPLVNDGDDVPVDDPNWLALISAAELIRTDLTRQNQYPNLIAEANQSMQRMKDDNEGQDSSIYRPWNPMPFTDGQAYL